MLNDVHIPPVTPPDAVPAARPASASRPAARRLLRPLDAAVDANTRRVLQRVPEAARSDAPEAIYGEPEDRGNPFNTILSATVFGAVVVVVVGLSWIVFL